MGLNWNLSHTYSELPADFFYQVHPTPVKAPRLVIFNSRLSKELGLGNFDNDADLSCLSGNQLPPSSFSIAQAYSGHQFGHFNHLGDGRAILLGEQTAPNGKVFDVQLKGAGPTPYSRQGDGRAALGPMLREYIISEALHHLHVPCTRSLGVMATGEPVFREQILQGAILTRIASSHIRVGSFQFAASLGKKDLLENLTTYSLRRHFPDFVSQEESAFLLLQKVAESQAQLMAQWLQFGFVHGVMNTDNMAISGESLDFGPCAFLDDFKPLVAFSSIDRLGRYAFGNQPSIALWNLTRLAESLLPLLSEDLDKAQALAQETLANFRSCFERKWSETLMGKLGLVSQTQMNQQIASDFLNLLEKYSADYTNSFRQLTHEDPSAETQLHPLSQFEDFKIWRKAWIEALHAQERSWTESFVVMNLHNPSIIPRNHKVEEAIQEAQDELSELQDPKLNVGNLRNGSNSSDSSRLEELKVPRLRSLLHATSDPFGNSAQFEEYRRAPGAIQNAYKTFCGT